MRSAGSVILLTVGTLIVLGCRGGEDVPASTRAAVQGTIAEQIHARGDTLTATNPVTGEAVHLTFDRVHEDVAATPGGRWIACVLFEDPRGERYDLDYYVDDSGAGAYEIEDVIMHEAAGRSVIPDRIRQRLDDRS